ncbi:MAG: hypothetical protein H6559_38125 [Lewinellaceae bacterium]|nr:hypothetical protein [Lewinellaceae bacterium]
MKELPKILELLRALQEEEPRAGQCPMPGPCAPGKGCASACGEAGLAAQQHYSLLLLWAAGHYAGKIALPQTEELVGAYLQGCCHAALCGFPLSEPPGFETLRQGLQAFIDGWLD